MPDPTDDNPAPPAEKPAPKLPGPDDDTGVPDGRWLIGVAFSIFLILGGAGAAVAFGGQLYALGTLGVCIGCGIALAAFGTRIGGSFLTFNVVGGGAMAIALYLLLLKYPLSEPSLAKQYIEGQILETSTLKDVRGRAKDLFLTGRTSENGDFRFIIFEDELGEGQVRFKFDFPEGDAEKKEFSINCISARELKAGIDKHEALSLALEEETDGKFRLIETSSGREIGRLNERNCNAPAAQPSVADEVGFLDWLSIAAHAQQGSAIDIPKTLALLESEDGDQRDLARDQLASLRGSEAYKAVTSSWNIADSSYRADLGRLVAWSAAIGQDRATAVTLAEALSRDQLRYLVQLTGQGDITMRQYATEVLHRLLETTSWPNGPSPERSQEIVAATLAVFASPGIDPLPKPDVEFSPTNLLYNTAVAIDFAGCNIGLPYRPSVTEALSAFSGRLSSDANFAKTVAKASEVLAALKKCT